MKISRIGIVSVFIILLSVSCRSGEDMSAYFDEGRIENNTYISDSTGWKMMIPEGWRLTLKVKEDEANRIEKKYNEADVITPAASSVTWLIAFEKDKYNVFRSSYEMPMCANDDDLKKSINVERDFLPNLFPLPIKVVSVHPIVKEVVNGISFYSYTYECFLPEPINKKLYGCLYFGIVENKYFAVVFRYTNLENRKEIMDAWYNSTFDKSKWKSIR